MPPWRVVVIGGGIAGLATAYGLQQQVGEDGCDCTLLEASARLGGVIRTERVDGFLIEAGPEAFLTQKPWALELCQELGLGDRLIPADQRHRRIYILSGGVLHELPAGMVLAIPTRLWPFLNSRLLSVSGKARAGLDLLCRPRAGDTDESLAAFMIRHFGREVLEKIAEPLMAGIYAGVPERLSAASTFPRFVELGHQRGSLIRGLRTRDPSPPFTFVTLPGGLGELVEHLVARLTRVQVRTKTAGLRIERREGSTPRPVYHVRCEDGAVLEANAVVLAVPASAAARLLEPLDPELATLVGGIQTVSTAAVVLGYRRAEVTHPLNGFGFVVPRRERGHLLACTWLSTKFPHMAPADHVLLRVFVGGARDEAAAHLDDDALIRLVRGELAAILGLEAEPVLCRLYRWQETSPQYVVGHHARLAAIEARLGDHPGLWLTGSAYRGVGIPDCIHDGRHTAARTLHALLSPHAPQLPSGEKEAR